MRILVTGGAGLIGSHLCERLLAQGHLVACLDDFSTSEPGNVSHLVGSPRFQLHERDITRPIELEVDEIYNLACPASPVHYQRDPVRTLRTSIVGAMNMLELARHTGARVLQASTSEVYGSPLVHPQPESYWGNVNPVGPRACYDEGKRAAETLFADYRRMHGMPVRIARIFNTYGPRMHPHDGRVVSNFVMQALAGEDITIYGDGSQTRSFCYVDDLVEGLIALMASDHAAPVNLGNPVEFTMIELAQAVIELTGSRSRLVRLPLPEDDPPQRQPDIGLARKLLGWEPRTQLREGLARTIRWFRERYSAARPIP